MLPDTTQSERHGPTKRVRHYDIPGHLHELTFSTYRRRFALLSPGVAELLAEAIDRAMARHNYALLAYVFMPEHVHLLVHPVSNASPVAGLLKAIKNPSSARVRRLLETRRDPLLRALRATIDGRDAFRLWQAGPGYDRNITNEQAMVNAIEYIHANPVRRGLVDHPRDWRWSSWCEYADHTVAEIRSPRVTLVNQGHNKHASPGNVPPSGATGD